MLPSQTPILATGKLYGPMKSITIAAVLLFLHVRICGSSAGVSCRGAARVCLEVTPDHDAQQRADSTVSVHCQAEDSLSACM